MSIQYKELFDFDGLDAAFKDLEQSEEHFAKAVVDDLKRIQKQSSVTKSELQKLADALKGVNVTNAPGRDVLSQLASDSEKATRAFVEQNNVMNSNRNITAAVREEINKLKAEQQALKNATEENKNKAAEYRAENERLKAVMQGLRNELAQARISQSQYTQESNRARTSQQQLREEIARTRLEEARQTAEHRRLMQETQRLTAANRAASSAVNVAAGSYREAQIRLTTLGNSIKNAENGFKNTTPAVQAQIREYNSLNDALKRFDAQMGNHQRNVGNYGGALGGLVGQLSSMASAYLSAGAALSYSFSTAMNIDAIKTSMTFTLGSADAANQKLEMLRKTADRLGLEYVSLAGSYKSFTGAAVAANYPLKEADRIFNAVANAGGKLKLSTDQINGSLTALQQMISKGTVQSEELRGQLGERLPGAFSIAARAMGVTTIELGNMLKNGEVLASDLLPKLADELDKTFHNDKTENVSSLQAAVNRLKNTFSTAVEDGNITKFFQAVVEGANASASAIKNLVESSSWKSFFSRLASGMMGNGSFMSDAEDEARRISSLSPAKRSLEKFNAATPAKQRQMVIDQTLYRDKAYEQANQLGASKETIANYNKEQQILVALRKAYQELYNTKADGVKSNKDLEDSELTSLTAIRKRISELSKMDGSAIAGTEVFNRIQKLKAMLKELTSTASAKDGIQLLEEQIQKMERAIQLQALAARNKGMDFAPSKEALANLQELKDKLQYVKDLLEGVNRNKLGALTAPSTSSNSALKTAPKNVNPNLTKAPILVEMTDDQVFDAMSKAIEQRNKKLTDQLAAEYKRRGDLRQKELDRVKASMHQSLSFLENGFINVAGIVGDQWTDMFSAMTNSLNHYIDSMKNGLEDGKISFQDFANIANGIVSGVSGSFQAASDARITALETEKDRELTAAGDNATAKLAIEDNYNKKISAEKRKQAKLDKEMALLSIAINTAAAVASVLSTGGGTRYADFGISASILSALVIGIGAAQAALVLAKPIPQFYTGTNNAPEGVAEVAERGPELQINPDGSKELNTKRQFKYLKKGTQIKNAGETSNWLSAQRLFVDRNGNLSSLSNSDELHGNMAKMDNYHYVMMNTGSEKLDYDRLINGIGNKIKDIPHDEHYFDDRGYSNYRVTTNTRIKNLNAINSRRGNG